MWIEGERGIDYLIDDWTELPPDAHSLHSAESLFGDFVSGWVCVKLPCGAAAEAIRGTEKQLAHRCLGNFPQKDSLLKDEFRTAKRNREERGKGAKGGIGGAGIGQRWEGAVIVSGLLLPLITIMASILCCVCLKWCCRLFIKPALPISELPHMQSVFPITSASLCELTAYVRASMCDNEELRPIWIGFPFCPLRPNTITERERVSFALLEAARISSR